MSQEESMKLAAEVVDKFSGPLKDMQAKLKATADAAKHAHASGTAQAREHAKAYRELHDRIGKTKEMVAGVLSPALAALGITGFTAGEAISKLIDNLKSAAENYHKMNDAARRLGGSVDDVNEITNAYTSMGVAQDKAIASSAALGFHMDRLRRGNAEERGSWYALGGSLQALWPQLEKTKTNIEALQVVRDFQSRNHIPVDQMAKLWGFLGQPEELGTKTGEEYAEAFQNAIKDRLAHPDNAALNKGLAKAFDDLRYAQRGFGWEMNETFGPKSIQLIGTVAFAIDDLGGRIKTAAGWVHSFFTEFDHIASMPAEALKKWLDSPSDKSSDKSKTYSGPGAVGEGRPGWSPAQMLGAGMQPVSFSTGSDAESMLATGVKIGMLAAFREWFASTGAGSVGYQKASYSDGPPASTRSASDIAAGFGNKNFPNRGSAPDDAGPPDVSKGENNDAALAPSDGGINRDKWLAQLNANRVLKESLFRHSLGENSNPQANQAVMEEAANRADIRGNKRFDEHGNLSYFQGYYGGRISAKQRAMLDSNFHKVFSEGSDISNGAIDNSSQGLAWVHEHGGASGRYGHPGLRPGRFRTTANFGGDGITGHRGVESFEAPGWGESGRGERDRYPEFRKNQLAEAAQRREQMNHTVKGDAALGITLNGFPKGTRTDLTYGGLFTSYNLSRGQQMEPSEQK